MDNSLPYQIRHTEQKAICRNCGEVVYYVESDGYMVRGWFAVENGDTNVVCPKADYGYQHRPQRKTITKL